MVKKKMINIKVRAVMLEMMMVLMQVLFVALKLTHNIDWGWIAVLSPVIIWASFYLCVFIVIAIIILFL